LLGSDTCLAGADPSYNAGTFYWDFDAYADWWAIAGQSSGEQSVPDDYLLELVVRMRVRRRLLATISLGIALAGVGVSAALGAFDNNPKAVPSPAPPGLETAQASPGQGVGSVDSSVVAAFRAFRRAPTSADAIKEARALQGLYHPQQQYRANPSLARNVYSGPDGGVYLVPAQGRLCLVTVGVSTGVTVGCTALSDAIKNGVGTVFTDGAVTTLAGVPGWHPGSDDYGPYGSETPRLARPRQRVLDLGLSAHPGDRDGAGWLGTD
jgi:hypothetical protein